MGNYQTGRHLKGQLDIFQNGHDILPFLVENMCGSGGRDLVSVA